MLSSRYYHNEPDVPRCAFMFFTLMTDGFDFYNVFLSMGEMRSKHTLDTGTYVYYLYFCSCFCLGFSSACLLCTRCCPLPFPILDGVYCLVVWAGDLPQACLDVYFSKDPVTLHTIFNLPDAAAVLAVTLARIGLLFSRRTRSGRWSGPGEECGEICQIPQAIGLAFNLFFALMSLGIQAIHSELQL